MFQTMFSEIITCTMLCEGVSKLRGCNASFAMANDGSIGGWDALAMG